MAEMVTVTSKGQLVIPAKLRKKFGIRKGTRMSVREEGNHLILQPITAEYIHSLRGILPEDSRALEILYEERKRDREL
jgi:AbrB family looped-hinge helix DNA binding protein